MSLGAWRGYADREYWQAVASERTLFPESCPTCDCTACVTDEIEFVAWQQPQDSQFDLSQVTIPKSEIRSGGPPKDGIPALTSPKLLAADAATYLRDDDRVIGVVIGDEARAYPLAIMNHHEVVNDQIGSTLVAVTYCPLCDSAAVLGRQTPLGEREFGVSGLLYNSNVLMYDRGGKPESLWTQVGAAGVSGPAADKPLDALPVELTTWKDWRTRHPQTQVLSDKTGHRRDYRRNPYASYFRSPSLMFPAKPASDRLPAKAKVLGVWTDSAARAYPASAFHKRRTRVEDTVAGKRVVIEFNPEADSLRVAEAEEGVRWMYSFWFAWYAFHPQTEVFK
ncbi:MAG: DUF3179 domain-containing protein [Planctomycetaceae bacterium]|nr:DUF3179 domain-containing protein [Planctomycetaceae bacterium]